MADNLDPTPAILAYDVVHPPNINHLFAKFGATQTAKAIISILRDHWRSDVPFFAAQLFILDLSKNTN
jgi:hypothetical protein